MSCYDINEDSVTIKNRSVDSASAAVLEKVQKYEHFVNDVLKSDLRHVLEERDKVYDEIAEYMKLQTTIERLQTIDKRPVRTKLDVGCNYYMQAEVKDTEFIFVDIGMGLHVQMKFVEALKFLAKKIDQLNLVSERHTDKSMDIKARIKLIVEALAELQGFNKGSGSEGRGVVFDPFT